MAEQKRKAGRPRKTESTPKVETTKTESTDNTELIKQLMAQIEEQNKKMAEMQEKLANAQAQTVVVTNDSTKFVGRKIKLINLMHNILNVSTGTRGKGRVYTFNNYGDSKLIKFDDVCDIVSSYPYTVENGLVYIADKDVVEFLGLTEEYSKIYDKKLIDEIVLLKEDKDADLFMGMEKNLRESTATAIAERINSGENVNFNVIRRIKDECGIDILKLADDIKAIK